MVAKTLKNYDTSYNVKDRLCLSLFKILALIGLNLVYRFIIVNEFSYYGYFNNDFNSSKFLLIIFLVQLLLILEYLISDSFYLLVYNIIFLYYFGGESIYYKFNNYTSPYQLFASVIILVLLVLFSKIKTPFKFPSKSLDSDKWLGIISMFMFSPFLLLYFKYININNLLLKDVYITRAVFKKVSRKFTGYIFSPLSRVLLPVLIINKLEKKEFRLFVLYTLMLIYLYLVGALKSVFIGLLSLIVFYKGNYIEKSYRFIYLILFLTYFGLLYYYLTGSVFFVDAFIRRVFFVPPYLGNFFHKLFIDNLTYMSHSPLSFGIIRPSFNIIREVGIKYYEGGSPNVGIITEMIFSFGFLGVFIGAILVSFIIYIIGSLRIKPEYFGITFVYIYYIHTSLLSTLLLTHGLAFYLLIAYLYLR